MSSCSFVSESDEWTDQFRFSNSDMGDSGANADLRCLDNRTARDMAVGKDFNIQKLLLSGWMIDGPPVDYSGEIRKGKNVQWVIKPTVRAPRHNSAKVEACQTFCATMVEFYIGRNERRSPPISASIFELLYGKGPRAICKERFTKSPGKDPSFTWYHLPANNVSLAKYQRIRNRAMLNLLNALQMEWVDVRGRYSCTSGSRTD